MLAIGVSDATKEDDPEYDLDFFAEADEPMVEERWVLAVPLPLRMVLRDADVERDDATDCSAVRDSLLHALWPVECDDATDAVTPLVSDNDAHALTEPEPHVEGEALTHALKLTDDEPELCGPVSVARKVSDADAQSEAGGLLTEDELENTVEVTDGDGEMPRESVVVCEKTEDAVCELEPENVSCSEEERAVLSVAVLLMLLVDTRDFDAVVHTDAEAVPEMLCEGAEESDADAVKSVELDKLAREDAIGDGLTAELSDMAEEELKDEDAVGQMERAEDELM